MSHVISVFQSKHTMLRPMVVWLICIMLNKANLHSHWSESVALNWNDCCRLTEVSKNMSYCFNLTETKLLNSIRTHLLSYMRYIFCASNDSFNCKLFYKQNRWFAFDAFCVFCMRSSQSWCSIFLVGEMFVGFFNEFSILIGCIALIWSLSAFLQ